MARKDNDGSFSLISFLRLFFFQLPYHSIFHKLHPSTVQYSTTLWYKKERRVEWPIELRVMQKESLIILLERGRG